MGHLQQHQVATKVLRQCSLLLGRQLCASRCGSGMRQNPCGVTPRCLWCRTPVAATPRDRRLDRCPEHLLLIVQNLRQSNVQLACGTVCLVHGPNLSRLWRAVRDAVQAVLNLRYHDQAVLSTKYRCDVCGQNMFRLVATIEQKCQQCMRFWWQI